MSMKRGLSASDTPGDDQRFSTEDYDMEAGKDRTDGFEKCEQLSTNTMAPYLPTDGLYMIDDDHYEIQAESRAITPKRNPKECTRPLADAACRATLRFIAAVSLW